ncbi:hypothetical protein [Cellulosimicrobium arenosum]|uniref:Uncharacterized protein n=1 Tax=Cellulosimicrobium arenosum TaxID=2708133 RepID=A0A927G7N9_9MICO|nr:hypothetical protein [Cellulosimicrobium arenosum]MBD8078431.1 hypothetical protein [Cellulosimicrobium arenosum]
MTAPYDPSQAPPPPPVDDTYVPAPYGGPQGPQGQYTQQPTYGTGQPSYGAPVPTEGTPGGTGRPRNRDGLVVGAVAGGSLVFAALGLVLTYSIWGPPSYPDPVVAAPAPVESTEPSEDPAEGEAGPEDEPTLGSDTVNAPLDDTYRASDEMDAEKGPDLAPMSWDYYGDNDWVVNDYDLSLTARHDFDCADMPAIPALTEGVGDACEQGFEVRIVSGEGQANAIDLVVVDVGSEDEADEIAAAFEADVASDGPLADTSGAADEELRAPAPPGYEDAYAGLDKGYAGGNLISTGEVVVLIRPADLVATKSPEFSDLVRAAALVVTDHEVAKLF